MESGIFGEEKEFSLRFVCKRDSKTVYFHVPDKNGPEMTGRNLC